MKRYDPVLDERIRELPTAGMEECPNGDYVLYRDVESIVGGGDGREQFEAWISSEPYCECVARLSGDDVSWPGQYRKLNVQLAWQAWKGSRKLAQSNLLAACNYLLECVYAGTTQIIEQEPEYGQSPVTALDMIRDAVEKAKTEGQ